MLHMIMIPLWLVGLYAFIFGVVIGSFLNVYIYRFHTGKSFAGSSHCLSCLLPLQWYDLFPLLSYIVLRGRCRQCTARIPSRYFWVELVTGILFVSVVYLTPVLLWPVNIFLMAVFVVVAVYDLYHFIIPNEFIYTLGGVTLVLAGFHWYQFHDLINLVWSVLAAVLAFSFFASLWLYSKGRWIGFGDAKLVLPLGFIVGINGVFSMLVLSFWIGTIISLVLIGWQHMTRRGQSYLQFMPNSLTIKSEVPFAPFLILGFLAVYLGGVDVLKLFSYAL